MTVYVILDDFIHMNEDVRGGGVLEGKGCLIQISLNSFMLTKSMHFFIISFFFPRLSWQYLLNKRRARIFQELLCVKTGGRGGGEDKSAVCLQN